MSIQTIELVRGKDRKLYPAGGPRPAAEVERLRSLTHSLACGQGLSERAAQRALLEEHGVRRSTGIIHRDLAEYDCGGQFGRPCKGAPAG